MSKRCSLFCFRRSRKHRAWVTDSGLKSLKPFSCTGSCTDAIIIIIIIIITRVSISLHAVKACQPP